MNALYLFAFAVPLCLLARRVWTWWRWRTEIHSIPRHLPFKTYALYRGDFCWHRVTRTLTLGMDTACKMHIQAEDAMAIRNTGLGWRDIKYTDRLDAVTFPCPVCVDMERRSCSVPS